jgi:PHD/YefM family antitoxin component YafN of YafNO toxin-antitoxin module
MFRTTTVTELRADLSSIIANLEDGPLLVLSHSKPKAMLIEPELFDNLLERVELLEDLLDGRQALAEYIQNPDIALNAEEIFKRIGQ